ncbi:hypothetical protein Tco_0292021 [Tanacetum coccineum]
MGRSSTGDEGPVLMLSARPCGIQVLTRLSSAVVAFLIWGAAFLVLIWSASSLEELVSVHLIRKCFMQNARQFNGTLNATRKRSHLQEKESRGDSYGIGGSDGTSGSNGKHVERKVCNGLKRQVKVLQKSLEELKQARARDKDLLEKAKEDNIMQYEEKLKVSFVDNEGINGERGECKDDEGREKKSMRMERKLTRKINKPECNTDSENSDKEMLTKIEIHVILKSCNRVAGDGVAGIKRRRRDQSSDGVRIMVMASGRGRLKEDLESFYQNDDTPPWGNNKRKEKGEDGPEWVVRIKFEDELANFMLKKKSHTKRIREMLDQHRKEMHEQFSQILSAIGKSETPKPEAPTFSITTRSGVSTRDPPFPTPLKLTPANHTEGATEKEGPEGVEPSITHNEEPAPWPSIFYQPSKSSNLPIPS